MLLQGHIVFWGEKHQEKLMQAVNSADLVIWLCRWVEDSLCLHLSEAQQSMYSPCLHLTETKQFMFSPCLQLNETKQFMYSPCLHLSETMQFL